MTHDAVVKGLKLMLDGIELLQRSFSRRRFTIDGRLVGDLGEIIAEAEFDLILDEVSRPVHDAKSGRREFRNL